MTNFIVHDLEKNSLKCRGCMESVSIPARVLRSHMPQEAVLIFKQEFAKQHIEDGCDEAADKVRAASYQNRIRASNPGMDSLRRAQLVLG